MADNSDFSKDRTTINDLLPEVHRTDINKTVFEAAFNKFLTKEDTVHVAGYIGAGNPQALVKRQLTEPSPHRQVHQLAPIMHTMIGTQQTVLTFKNFEQQLDMMGIDTDRMDQWANTLRFNWIPPINIDMFTNYADYFWKPETGQTPPQYFTIENICNKATSKLNSYKNIINRRGVDTDVLRIEYATNAFVVAGKQDDLYVTDFVFKTTNTININLSEKSWIVVASYYTIEDNTTTIVVQQPISVIQLIEDANNPPPLPAAAYEGQWLYKYSDSDTTPISQLFAWSGTEWNIAPSTATCTISLAGQEAVYQSEVNCACHSDTTGWDTTQWDDNKAQSQGQMWNADVLLSIQFNTEQEWLDHNGQTQPADLWHDTTHDLLLQRNAVNTHWVVVSEQFSDIIEQTAGVSTWDETQGCEAQKTTQWSDQNKWVHKSELTTFVGARRAQVPILEYSSQLEKNEWTETVYHWKYRSEKLQAFSDVDVYPHRFELEPIKSYVADNVDGIWRLFLATSMSSANRDINYTRTFVPGYKFRIVNRLGTSLLFTVASSEYREIDDTDPLDVPRDSFVTVVVLVEDTFDAPLVAGIYYETTDTDTTPPYTRIEPIRTSRGDSWKGYHVHWLMDAANTHQRATAPHTLNPYVKYSEANALTNSSANGGIASLALTYQEFVPSAPTPTIYLDSAFGFDADTPKYYALAGENQLQVYLNGVRQYGTYTETVRDGSQPVDYTIVDTVGLLNSASHSSVGWVHAIHFDRELTTQDRVRIDVAPQALDDMGMYSVPVRTIEDDDEFAAAAAAGAQPVYKSLVRFRKTEQVKNKINQYPLFNVYDIPTGQVVHASPLFAFAESLDQPVNSSTQRRIIASPDGKEYQFEQTLVDEDTGRLYAYRLITGSEPEYWYNPTLEQLKQWDGTAWGDDIMVHITTGLALRAPIISATEPTEARNISASIWVNTTTQEIFQRDTINNVWSPLSNVVINNADPTLNTVWRASATDEYVPKYINRDSIETPIGSPDGDWEVVSQWKNNPSHENHKYLQYTQLITHMMTIINQQDPIPGLPSRGIFTQPQRAYNYSVGGTIKEHNNAFEMLISSVNVNDVTPVSVIEFAQEQYSSNFTTIRDMFVDNLSDLLIEFSGYSVEHIASNVIDYCITQFANNSFMSKIYGDTSAYNSVTDTGMPNWIATMPMFRLSKLMTPHAIRNGDTIILRHHDGHRSFITLTVAEQDRISRILVKQLNAALPGAAVVSSTEPTGTLPVYWYRVGDGYHSLYKIKSQTPVVWEEVDFVDMMGKLFMSIEQRLYDIAPNSAVPLFDYDMLTVTEQQITTYNSRRYERFMDYIVTRHIKAPLTNTTYTITDPTTWNYAQSVLVTPPRNDLEPQPRSCWQAVYTYWYGTPYPHLEPWCMQGYVEKPDWWDVEYTDTTGTRSWKYNHATRTGMWENIRSGIIPVGKLYPNTTTIYSTGDAVYDGVDVPTYNYFSVNINDATIVGGYAPDSLLPPYYDNTSTKADNPTVRSLFTEFTTQIVGPSADFIFGEYGPMEWEWSISAESVYDKAIIAFQMQPVKFLHQSFGSHYASVGGLHVDLTLGKVHTHRDTLFHGDIYNTNDVYVANGINQWYTNFNRFNGYDTNVNFRSMWSNWNPRQAYQTAGIIDTTTLQVFNSNFDVTDKDFESVLVNSGIIKQLWLDVFNISVMAAPPSVMRYNNQALWKFAVEALSPVSRTIHYYGTQNWPFTLQPQDDTLTAFQFKVVDVNAPVKLFKIKGDQTSFILEGLPFVVFGSTTNDGSYTVDRSTYDASADITVIKVQEHIATSIIDGIVDVPLYSHNWNTGDVVHMTSTTTLPYPIEEGETYYVIVVDDRKIKLATNLSNAQAGIAIDITSNPVGEFYLGKVKATFNTMQGSGSSKEIWHHYEVNSLDIRTMHPPVVIAGMQNLINILDGYKALREDEGFKFNNNDHFVEYDSDTGRPVSWQLETERFIEWAFANRASRLQYNDRYEMVVSSLDLNTLKFTAGMPSWTTGTAVKVSSTNNLPKPLYENTPYYVITTDDPQVFKLATNPRGTADGVVDLLDVGGGIITITLSTKQPTYPSFEFNPCRNNVWIETPQGMLSNILANSYADVRVSQTLYDQFGRALTEDKITLYRTDKLSRMSVRPQLYNDVRLYPVGYEDPYDFVHIGGGHFFVEGYEHIIMFENYTVGDDLVYDPFLGLYIKRFDLDFFKKEEYTLRPTLGGYYLTEANNFKRNIEGSIQSLRKHYSVFDLVEGTHEAQHARHTVGYHPNDGSMSYLDLLNVNTKSQFLFYRGMIQTKGSTNSVKAFINSRKFVDAKIDEFWMYKVGEFGDSREKVYPKFKLFAADGMKADIRLKFAVSTDMDDSVIHDIERGFETVSYEANTRVVDFPQQRTELDSMLFLDASITSMFSVYVTRSDADVEDDTDSFYPKSGQTAVDEWMHINVLTNNITYRKWTGTEWSVLTRNNESRNVNGTVYMKLDQPADGIRVLRRRLTNPGELNVYRAELMHEVDLVNGYFRVNSEVVKFPADGYTARISLLEPDNTISVTIPDNQSAAAVAVGDRIKLSDATNNGWYVVENVTYDNNAVILRVAGVDGSPSLVVSDNTTLTHYGFADVLVIFTVNPNEDRINPARLLDVKSKVKMKDVPLWHPAAGMHSPLALHNIDLITPTDPARYTVTMQHDALTVQPWLLPETNTVWLDTSHLGYLPYYDDIITPNVDTRLFQWGKRPQWSSIKVYQWVESLSSPSDWAALSAAQSGSIGLLDTDKITGTPRMTTFRRKRIADIAIVVDTTASVLQLTTVNNDYHDGVTIMFNTLNGTDELPTTIKEGTGYVITQYDPRDNTFVLTDTDGENVDLSELNGGTPITLTVLGPFSDTWERVNMLRERTYAAIQSDFTASDVIYRNPLITLADEEWSDGDVVDVYVNGIMVASGLVVMDYTVDMYDTEYKMALTDIIDIIRPIPTPTDEQLAFDPDVSDDGLSLEQWTQQYEYATATQTTPDGITYRFYYYWVEDVSVRTNIQDKSCLSLYETKLELDSITSPYMVVQSPYDDMWAYGYDIPPWDQATFDSAAYTAYNSVDTYMPAVFYRKAILSKITSYITEDDRYVVEFTRDLTLRDTLTEKHSTAMKKNKHEKWFMFRRGQVGALPHTLWIKLTESLMQCKYDDFNIRVPSFDHEHYDATHGTETRYGMDDGQTFVDPTFARATLVHYLQDPLNDFKPVDINEFFERFPATDDAFWLDPQQIRDMCDYIYYTFNTLHTNNIWFNTLLDAMVTKSKYKGIQKTSWLALHGIRILDINGMFDDY